MKLAFSTLGCPDFDWQNIYTMAYDLGFSGIELRGLGNEILGSNPFDHKNIKQTKKQLTDNNLSIPCISTGCALKFEDKRCENIEEIKKYIDLAFELKSSYIRILGDLKPFVDGEVSDDVVCDALLELIPYAQERNITLLVETNGVYADTTRLKNLLNRVKSDFVGALWDIHHPIRFFGEAPETTIQNLGAYIKYVHIKDSLLINGNVQYKLIGEGDLPIQDAISSLMSINYEGFISLEWVKRYTPDLSDPGIVFPHFSNYMENIINKNNIEITHANDVESKPCDMMFPKDTLIDLTFPELLDLAIENYPDNCAFKYTTLDYTRTYKEFGQDVDNFAKALIAIGVKAGDHVAIWATNIPQWFITFWATTKIGAVLVTVNTAYKIHEAEYLLRQSDTHTLVMMDGHKDTDYIGIMKQLCPELQSADSNKPLHLERLPFLRNIITVDSKHNGCRNFDEVLELAKTVSDEELNKRFKNINTHDVCNMQYTSGTTGFPKGVMLTHYNVVNNGKAIGDCMNLTYKDRMMIQVPMFHCFGMVLAMTASVSHGNTMLPIPAFSPKKGLECVNNEQVTAFHGVPTMFIAMLEHEDFEKTDFSHVRTGIMAGSPCPINVMQDVLNKMNMNEVCITYGQTEASPGCTMSKTTDSIDVRVSTVGGPIFGVECKIVDPETGKDLGDEEDGEFVARGYNIMKGYYKMPAATAAAIDKDGWLHTGDLARRTKEGNYKITGRIKDMIIRGGENIYPKEIEEFLYTHPDVSDVQVIGVPDEQYGEEIMACIILKQGKSLTEQEVKDYVLAHMAKHKTPRYVDFVDSFPMNAAGKIQKYKMREAAVEKLKLQAADSIETA